MEKIELKHLAPYLPYGLKARISIPFFDNKTIVEIVGLSENHAELVGIRKTATEHFEFNDIKPILRPLSDLTKEIEVNNEKFVPIEYLYKNIDCDAEYDFIWVIEDDISSVSDKIIFAPYSIMEKLFEWHFDVFGLIEKGLAIDFNTL